MAITAKRIWISKEMSEIIVGIEVQVFIPELSKYFRIMMSVADALEYCSKAWADVNVAWLNEKGETVKTFGKLYRKTEQDGTAKAGICFINGDLIAAEEGFPRACTEKAVPGNPEWYVAIGEMAYPLQENGMCDCNSPKTIGRCENRPATIMYNRKNAA